MSMFFTDVDMLHCQVYACGAEKGRLDLFSLQFMEHGMACLRTIEVIGDVNKVETGKAAVKLYNCAFIDVDGGC